MPENNLTDSELIAKVATYDSKALEELYNRYSTILYTLVKRIVGDVETAQEVFSDIFVIIWRKIDRFDFDIKNVYTWLITLARNKAVDSLTRKNNPEKLPEYNDEYENENILPKLSKEINTLELSDIMSMEQSIKSAVNSLTEAQRYVIDLAFYDGYDEGEIAKKLKIPLPTVKSKIQVAMDKLKQKLSMGELNE